MVFEEAMTMFAVIVTAAAGSVGTIFLIDFARNQQSKNQRQSELDAINHAQAMAALSNVSAQSTATSGDLISQDLADNKQQPQGGARQS